MKSNIPDIKVPFKGIEFTYETLIIVGLMRKLKITRIDLTELNLQKPKGLIIDRFLELQEK